MNLPGTGAEPESPQDSVLLSSEGRNSTITLNRPTRMNAVDLAMHLRLPEQLRAADRDPYTRVIIMTGAGRGFCAGGDVKDMVGASTYGETIGRRAVVPPGKELVDTILRLEKPLIAMVNGPAIGLGATMALLADVVMMADEAVIGDGHTRVGLVAGDGGALIWPALVGTSKAKELLMTGRSISGPEAERIGLVSRSLPLAQLRAAVTELADELAALAPYAVQATKVSLNRSLLAGSGALLDTSIAYEELSMAMQDHQEALRARADGRLGDFTGR